MNNNSASVSSTLAKSKTFPCFVTYHPAMDWLEIISLNTEKKYRLNMPTNSYVRLTGVERAFLARLTANPDADAETDLTYGDMRLFVDACKRMNPLQGYDEQGLNKIGESKPVVSVVEEEPEPEPEPEKEEAVQLAPTSISDTMSVSASTPIHVPVPSPISTSATVVVPIPKPQSNQQATTQFHKEAVNSHISNYGTGYSEGEINLTRKKRIVDRLKKGLVHFNYDIREELRVTCPNPSSILWRVGFRETKSCWCIFKDELDGTILRELFELWDEHKVKYRTCDFAEHEVTKLLGWAQESLDEELRRAHTSLITLIDSADKKLKEELGKIQGGVDDTEKSRKKLVGLRHNRVRQVLRDAANDLNDAIQCAENFDQTDNMSDLIQALRAAIRANVSDFNRTAREDGVKISTVQV